MTAQSAREDAEIQDAIDASEEPRTKPLSQLTGGGDGFPGVEQFEMEPSRRGLPVPSQGALLIILLLAVTAGVIYAMRATQSEIKSDSESQEAEAKIDQALIKLTGGTNSGGDPTLNQDIDSLFADSDRIVTMFSTDMTRQQVPIEFLQRKPFVQAMSKKSQDTSQPTAAAIAEADQKQQQREQLERQLAALTLQTVIMGRVNVAVIDNDLVQQNHKISGFIVKKINKMSVELEAGGEIFILNMCE